jgi:hypothetical protein
LRAVNCGRPAARHGRAGDLAALVVTETFASGRSFVLDARVAGLAAGAVALRAPLWLVVVAGGLATAVFRLLS